MEGDVNRRNIVLYISEIDTITLFHIGEILLLTLEGKF